MQALYACSLSRMLPLGIHPACGECGAECGGERGCKAGTCLPQRLGCRVGVYPRASTVARAHPRLDSWFVSWFVRSLAAQVLLQWNLRHGVAVVPKCSSIAHASQILHTAPPAAAALSPEQMEAIDAISNGANGGKVGRRRWVNPSFSESSSNRTGHSLLPRTH